MIIADVFTWLVISSPILGAIVIGSNAVSPGSAEAPFDWLTHTHNWASIFDATESIMMMTLIGEPSDVLTDGSGRGGAFWRDKESSIFPSERVMQHNCGGSGCRVASGVVFFMFYLAAILLIPIVLVNLLIAMMGNTYVNLVNEAQLTWRVNFASLVLRHESVAITWRCFSDGEGCGRGNSICRRLVQASRLGEEHGGHYYYTFLSFAATDDARIWCEREDVAGDIFANEKADEAAHRRQEKQASLDSIKNGVQALQKLLAESSQQASLDSIKNGVQALHELLAESSHSERLSPAKFIQRAI